MIIDLATVWLVCVLCLGMFVQSAAGFAGGLLIVPTLLWSGYSIPEAQTSLLVATIPQNIWGVWSFRDTAEPRRLVWPGVARLAMLPVGVAVLFWMESFSIVRLRQIVGAAVLLATLATVSFRPKPRHRLHPVWSWLAFPVSGFFQGVVGMGGPPMVLWVQAHDWDTRRSRAFLFSMYLISVIPAIVVLFLFFGSRVIAPGITAALATPLSWLSSWAGLKAGTALGKANLKRVTVVLLLLMGLAGLAAPWIGR